MDESCCLQTQGWKRGRDEPGGERTENRVRMGSVFRSLAGLPRAVSAEAPEEAWGRGEVPGQEASGMRRARRVAQFCTVSVHGCSRELSLWPPFRGSLCHPSPVLRSDRPQ